MSLTEKAERFQAMGYMNVMRDRAERSAFIQFFADAGEPLVNVGCSSCMSKAFYRLPIILRKLNEPKHDVMSNFKFKSDIPPYRAFDGNVYTNDNISDEVATGIIERNPALKNVLFESGAPVEEKPTRKTKKAETEKE